MILLLLAGLAAAPAHPPAATPSRCPPISLTYTRNDARAKGFKRLGDLPPANQYLAVERVIGGCRLPVIVRTGIGR